MPGKYNPQWTEVLSWAWHALQRAANTIGYCSLRRPWAADRCSPAVLKKSPNSTMGLYLCSQARCHHQTLQSQLVRSIPFKPCGTQLTMCVYRGWEDQWWCDCPHLPPEGSQNRRSKAASVCLRPRWRILLWQSRFRGPTLQSYRPTHSMYCRLSRLSLGSQAQDAHNDQRLCHGIQMG
jgi:hypothetical protein